MDGAPASVLTLALERMPGFELRWTWYISVATVAVQLALAMWFLRYEFGRRLRWELPMAT